MSEPFLGDIRILGFNFAPRGHATCDGQLLPISSNLSLYSLLGTTYGGDAETTFALPDLRGRVPVHVGDGLTQGQRAGEEAHRLLASEGPAHSHALMATRTNASDDEPAGALPASGQTPAYGAGGGPVTMSPGAVSIHNPAGGQAHENMQPFLTINFVIALSGLFPSRN